MRRVTVTPEALDFGDVTIPLAVQRSARARRIAIRLDPAKGGAILTLPQRAALRHGLDFAAERALWVRNRLARLPAPVPFADGAVLPIFGVAHRIEHRPAARGGVWREGATLVVSGAAEFLARRLTDWLRREALAALEERTRQKAARLGRPVARVFVRDTRSRWGSCAPDGRIHYSWRIVFAPEFVLDYLVAHEVAHLAHMNHGARFHETVDRLTPYAGEAQAWLRRFGTVLHRYGAGSG
jgi:hypothetical protein